MSSILNALKKVESAGPDAAPPRNPLRRTPTEQPSPSRRRIPPLRRVALAGALVLTAAAAVYVGLQPSERTGSEPAGGAGLKVQAQLPVAPAPQPAPVPQRTPLQPSPAPEPTLAPAPAPQTTALPEPGPEAAAPVQAPPPTARIRPREATPAAPPASDARPAPPQRAPSAPDRPAPARPAPTRSPEDSLSRLEESKLKVMAIAWAEDPGRRIAVVNGHIVKEGESVDGFTVTRIRQGDLVVSDGTRSWRVELNLRSQP